MAITGSRAFLMEGSSTALPDLRCPERSISVPARKLRQGLLPGEVTSGQGLDHE